jgi:hypothetical protein
LKLFMHIASCTAFIVVASVSPAGQTLPEPDVDVALGYQALHIPGQTYPLGIALSISAGLNDTVRIVGEAGVSIARNTVSTYGAGTLTLAYYGAGPRVGVSAGPVLFYGQLLGGGVRTHADLVTTVGTRFIDGDNAFMLQPGAGVVVPLTRRIAAIGEGNYQRVFFKEYGGDNETRVFVGVRAAFR